MKDPKRDHNFDNHPYTHAVLCNAMLYFTMLYYTVLYCTILYMLQHWLQEGSDSHSFSLRTTNSCSLAGKARLEVLLREWKGLADGS